MTKLKGETNKGVEIRRAMQKNYGAKAGKSVYFASINKGRLKGTHRKDSAWEKRSAEGRAERGPATFENAYNPDGTRKKLRRTHRRNISKSLQKRNSLKGGR